MTSSADDQHALRNPIPRPVHLANEALAFLLELASLAGLALWGFHVGPNLAAQLALGIGAPVVLIVVWALFCAPKARVKLPKVPLMALRTALLLGAAAAVFAAGWLAASLIFAAVIVLNAGITLMDRDALVNQR
ncbi:MAG: YrdB family protein [Pseudolysinimonas sp.]